jgi:hypothetical protein
LAQGKTAEDVDGCEGLTVDSATSEYLAKVKEVSARYFATGTQLSSDFSALQRRLDLRSMLKPASLLSTEARSDSRTRLKQLQIAFESYKSFYSSFVVNLSRDVLTCSSELPEQRRVAVLESYMGNVQNHVNEQAHFYQVRERWMHAVTGILDFFDAGPQTAQLLGEQLAFEDEQELATFNALADQINEAAAQERQLMELRVARIQARMGLMGNRSG